MDLNLTDKSGRTINYLRLSVTNKCNLNCTYCKRSADGTTFITLDEIQKSVKLLAECGVCKIRLTGGEPLVRDDIFEIISICKQTPGVREVAITTNGILLTETAARLKAAGLDRVNISIDSLDPQKYKKIARAGKLGDALAGVDAAINAGLVPVKINTVLIRGVNDQEIDDFIELTKNSSVQVRFIEYMPMGGQHEGGYISAQEVVSAKPQLKRCEGAGGVDVLYQVPGYVGKVGFITPVSRPFCDSCNRVRITADCKIRHCLGDNLETDLREILRHDDETARTLLREAAARKPERGFCEGFVTERGMGNIGG